MTAFKAVLEDVTAQLNQSLPGAGFPGGPVRINASAFRRQWRRGNGWKEDVVEIVYRRGGELRILVNLEVYLPKVDFVVDGIGLPTPSVAGFLAPLRAKRTARRTVDVILANLNWFDELATPQQCLSKLQPRLNKQATAVVTAVQFLLALSDR